MTDNTLTTEQRAKLREYLATHDLSKGVGTEESACSVAAINLAISGGLTDNIPRCMSLVLGHAVINLQDSMPAEMRNSERYKLRLLPDMAGTGREREKERMSILLDWMWETVLPQLQPIAGEFGFGSEWRKMCLEKTFDAARSTAAVAAVAASARADATSAALAADYAATAAARTANSLYADYAATYVAAVAANAASADFWKAVDPVGVLERMTYFDGDTK